MIDIYFYIKSYQMSSVTYRLLEKAHELLRGIVTLTLT